MFQCSWMQFADDAAIVSSNVSNSQQLLDIFKAWCNWAGMTIRLDKCCSFGMLKIDGQYQQFEPSIFLDHGKIPSIPIGSSFTYLGKLFNFGMKNKEAKEAMMNKLTLLLKITSALPVRAQLKLNILNKYIHANLTDDLKKYSLGVTWIRQNLDSECYSHVRIGWVCLLLPASKRSCHCQKRNVGLESHPLKK